MKVRAEIWLGKGAGSMTKIPMAAEDEERREMNTMRCSAREAGAPVKSHKVVFERWAV